MKKYIKKLLLKSRFIEKFAISICVKKNLLPEILFKTDSNSVRNFLNIPYGENITQLNQDIFALIVNKFKKGYFLEIGANNGYTLSNTVYLEEKFGWDGILVEANPIYKNSLNRRSSIIVNKAITDGAGTFEFISAGLYGGVLETIDKTHTEITKNSEVISVLGCSLEQILLENDAPNIIDFISIDVEGGELSILKQVCNIKNYRFRCGCIEHNFRENEELKFIDLLNNSGYDVYFKGKTGHDLFFIDNQFINYAK